MAEDLFVLAVHIRSLITSQIHTQLQVLLPSFSGADRTIVFLEPSGNNDLIHDIVRSQVEALLSHVSDPERRLNSLQTLDLIALQRSPPTEPCVLGDTGKSTHFLTPAPLSPFSQDCIESHLRGPTTVFHQKPSFSDVLAGSPPIAPWGKDYKEMVATRTGEFLSVTLDALLVKRGVEELQNSLIARLIPAKGEEPYSLEDLTQKLEATWNIYGGWKLLPIGRGYYNVQLPNLEDRDRILGMTSWFLKLGVIRVQRWVRDFNPYKTNTSIAEVWVRPFEIPMEYFQTPIIHALASALGTVIKLDDRTRDWSMCHHARVLIEIDMK
ncbi:hypothetical protein ACS0TY_030395 [Phlomoides rotata]